MKYGAKRTVCGAGHTHDSKLEAGRCDTLTAMEQSGEITHLVQQPAFPIVINGRPVCKVLGDFQYRMADSGLPVVVDVKGMDNPMSRLKRKLVEAAYPGMVMTVWPVKVAKKRKVMPAKEVATKRLRKQLTDSLKD